MTNEAPKEGAGKKTQEHSIEDRPIPQGWLERELAVLALRRKAAREMSKIKRAESTARHSIKAAEALTGAEANLYGEEGRIRERAERLGLSEKDIRKVIAPERRAADKRLAERAHRLARQQDLAEKLRARPENDPTVMYEALRKDFEGGYEATLSSIAGDIESRAKHRGELTSEFPSIAGLGAQLFQRHEELRFLFYRFSDQEGSSNMVDWLESFGPHYEETWSALVSAVGAARELPTLTEERIALTAAVEKYTQEMKELERGLTEVIEDIKEVIAEEASAAASAPGSEIPERVRLAQRTEITDFYGRLETLRLKLAHETEPLYDQQLVLIDAARAESYYNDTVIHLKAAHSIRTEQRRIESRIRTIRAAGSPRKAAERTSERRKRAA